MILFPLVLGWSLLREINTVVLIIAQILQKHNNQEGDCASRSTYPQRCLFLFCSWINEMDQHNA